MVADPSLPKLAWLPTAAAQTSPLAAAVWAAGLSEVAVDDLVAVRVGPAAVEDFADDGEAGVGRGVRRIVRRVGEVLAPVALDGRLAVAEHVPGRGDTRCQVVVRAHARRLRDRNRRRVQERRGGGAVLLGRRVARGPVVAQGTLQRHPAAGPAVLGEEAGNVRDRPPAEIRQPVRHRVRHALVEAVFELRLIGDRLIELIQPVALIADFHAVRAGHVGGRRLPAIGLADRPAPRPDTAVHVVRLRRIPQAGGRVDGV